MLLVEVVKRSIEDIKYLHYHENVGYVFSGMFFLLAVILIVSTVADSRTKGYKRKSVIWLALGIILLLSASVYCLVGSLDTRDYLSELGQL